MFKFLKGVVGGSGSGPNNLPYYIAEPYSSSWGSWSHSCGSSKDDGSPVSIVSLSGSNANDGLLAAGCNGVKRLCTVRHPNILSFLHSLEVETFDGSTAKVTIYIVTEPVMPLSEKIRELGLEGTQRDEYYAWGLNQITKAGPYVYYLYSQYGFGKGEIGQLFIAGFGSSTLFRTIVGSLADKQGRKRACVTYCIRARLYWSQPSLRAIASNITPPGQKT
ncbi:putative inactive serine/threonine-protein kinase scy1 [Camellia lanceoleosa]|uniref:Inactive serine/threonine-protein kinase scy1 n=1 Tax=Camellia lanceoleosa TaxID=1840588 RepID=A0ACC0FG44_9ERIC|nr:putative inactive serine/threonine-protein kinase scy1 [Camellia lanceoleosa]